MTDFDLIEFTTEEADVLALGWLEALLMARIPECPVADDEVRFLCVLTPKVAGVLREHIVRSADVLEECIRFHEPYHVHPDPMRDPNALLEQIYPMQQDGDDIRRRLQNAISLLRGKLAARP